MSDAKTTAIGVIRREHRTLAAVLNSMKSLVTELAAGRMKPDFGLLWTMVYYIDAFPDRQHHPKEDLWLFAKLRERTPVADALIDELQQQHREEPQALNALRQALGNFEAGVAGSGPALQQAVNRFADFTWKHLKTEEQVLLPLAEAHLLPSDWDALAQAFGENTDPLATTEAGPALDAMFRNIVLRTPAPLGLGAQPAP
jgi:hemerythrin-like domain-containing protein